MHHYSQGKATKQGHKAIPEGHFEEEQGRDGFFGPVSHLIRKKPSTGWSKISGPLKPCMFDLVELAKNEKPQRLLYNNDVAVSQNWMQPKKSKSSLQAQRSADGDLLYFCHRGSGEVWTEYGLLKYSEGMYIVIPKCVTYVILPSEDSCFLIIEAKNSSYKEPARGMVGRNAFYDTNAISKPNLELMNQKMLNEKAEVVSIEVKHNGELTVFEHDENIFDVVGWKGDLFPFTLHMDDLMPLLSARVHLPPSAHTTFVASGFVVCSFLPRPLEEDKDALRVPFYHQNIDYDEVLFYHNGDFFSRDGLHSGMMSFHPAGFPHGPHPKAVKSIEGKTHTNEYAVMIDTRNKLIKDEALSKVEVENYWKSWKA